MKLLTIIPALLLTFTSNAFAQTSPRDVMIEKIEAAYTQNTMITAESPFLKNMLSPAIRVNPGVSQEIWAGIAKEVAPAISNVIVEKGGVLDTLLRTSLEPMTEDELKKLETILNDPTYLKFHAMMAAPSTQQQLIKAIMVSTPKMGIAINAILVKHGLQEVH